MFVDKKTLRVISAAAVVALLSALFIPGESSGRIVSSILLPLLAAVSWLLIKKREALSINKREITLLSFVFGVVFLMLYYLTGLPFGFVKNIYVLNLKNFFSFILPITLTAVASEVFRYVIRQQDDRLSDVLSYFACVFTEALIYGNIYYVNSFNRFMDFMGLTLFPAIIGNLLYHYLTKRYGMAPNIIYRLIVTLYLYIIPVVPAMADSLFSLYSIAFPIVIYAFIDALYERKKRYALEKKNPFTVPITAISAIIMIALVMLISNQFRFGALVIATPSMTGELNVGDSVIYERYDDQIILEGQIIVFEQNDSMIVHRVAKIEKINGETRYYTKGDANDVMDAGYIKIGDVVGLIRAKVPYVGYPTLWMRDLFNT